MKLSVLERVLLGGMMSTYQGSFTNLKIIREGREAISFKDDELMKLNFEEGGGTVKWNPQGALEIGAVEIDLSLTVIKVLKDMFMKLNDEQKLTEQHFSLCEKFLI
jgi:hypothetical protein